MGAWGAGNFENDSALNWLSNLLRAEDAWGKLRAALKSSTVPADSIGEFVLAAAECVAICRGKPPVQAPPADALAWCARNKAGFSEELRVLALKAVQNVRADSDLKILWAESDSRDEWTDVVTDLEKRLSS